MTPNPLGPLNHLTVPLAIGSSFLGRTAGYSFRAARRRAISAFSFVIVSLLSTVLAWFPFRGRATGSVSQPRVSRPGAP